MTEVHRPLYRMPLQSRNPNAVGAMGSFNNSSTDGYDSKEIGLSKLESSGNENNKRLTSSASYAIRRQNSAEVRDAPAGGDSSGRSGSAPRAVPSQRSSSLPSVTTVDEETVIIEEKRRRVNGEGYTLHRYLRGRLLGKGGFAKVYLCTALDTNKAYAIKIVPKANLVKARARQKLQAEIKIHRTLKHPYVCEYKHFFEDKQNCYILLELCHNQSMNEMIKRRKRLTEAEAAYFGRQLLEAIQYLHENLVIHRDLKLGNLFLDRNMNIKVGDLGLATKLESAEEKRKTICGTPNYIAPEVIQGDRATRGHSFEVDIWSMGVILYTCMCGRPPYEAKDVKATYQRIIANEYSFPRDVKISDSARDIIRSMLQSNPLDRPTVDEIAIHPFFTQQAIPQSVPSTATHVAPQWEENEYGELVVASTGRNQKQEPIPNPGLPKSNSLRRPFASRDVNADRATSATDKQKIPSKSGRDVMEGAMKSAFSALANIGSGGNKSPAPQPAFRVFDESEDARRSATSDMKITKVTTPAHAERAEADLVNRAAAMSIRRNDVSSFTKADARANLLPPPAVAAATTSRASPNSVEQDTQILSEMIERIDAVLEVTAQRNYAHVHPDSPSLTAFSRGGPQKWVARYVDYTSKYGLGFLLNDGSSGVYFNDSTKTVLEAVGENFQYIERKKSSSDDVRRGEPVLSAHTLSSFPEELQKKVTLLKHFRNYLMEQQKKSDEEDFFGTSNQHKSEGPPQVYLKKWARTKHAIFFRLSDHTVQIVFYDHTEVLLTPDERHITYVDKQRSRKTYYLTDELVGHNAEIAKRLKYTKEILQQLVTGQKH